MTRKGLTIGVLVASMVAITIEIVADTSNVRSGTLLPGVNYTPRSGINTSCDPWTVRTIAVASVDAGVVVTAQPHGLANLDQVWIGPRALATISSVPSPTQLVLNGSQPVAGASLTITFQRSLMACRYGPRWEAGKQGPHTTDYERYMREDFIARTARWNPDYSLYDGNPTAREVNDAYYSGDTRVLPLAQPTPRPTATPQPTPTATPVEPQPAPTPCVLCPTPIPTATPVPVLEPLRPGERREVTIPPGGTVAIGQHLPNENGVVEISAEGSPPMVTIRGRPQQCGIDTSWLLCTPQPQCEDGRPTTAGDALIVLQNLAEGKWLTTGAEGSTRRSRVQNAWLVAAQHMAAGCSLPAPSVEDQVPDQASACVAAPSPRGTSLRQRMTSIKKDAPKPVREVINTILVFTDAELEKTFSGALTQARCWSGGQKGPSDPYAYPADKVKSWMLDMSVDAPFIRAAIERTPAEALKWGWLRAVEIRRGLPYRKQ